MNDELVTYTVTKKYVTGNWELTYINLKERRWCSDNIEPTVKNTTVSTAG